MSKKQGYELLAQLSNLLRKMKNCDGCSLGKDECDRNHDKEANRLIEKTNEYLKFKEN